MATAKISAAEFDEFWQCYPRKIAKLAAQKAYEKARRSGVSQQELIAGVERYIRHKPAYADWAFPASWLNKGRWADEWDAKREAREDAFTGIEQHNARQLRRAWGRCLHDPQCESYSACLGAIIRSMRAS